MGEALEKARAAKDASRRIGMLGSAERAQVICAMAKHLRAHGPAILAANAADVADARAAGVSASLVDRLMLDEGRVVGCGTHAELMDACEPYREIALSQLSEEELEGGDAQ